MSCCKLLYYAWQSLLSLYCIFKLDDSNVIYQAYVTNMIAVVCVLNASFLVLANLQTMTDTLILPRCRAS